MIENKEQWRGSVLRKSKFFVTEREAAVYVDKVLINAGKQPVNIMIKKL